MMLFQARHDAALLRGRDVRPSEEEVRGTEEERIQVLNNIEELEQKIKELDNQMEESAREVRGDHICWVKILQCCRVEC